MAGQKVKPSVAWKEGTPAYFLSYGCIILELLVLQIGDASLFTQDVLDAFHYLGHTMV